MLVQPQNLLRRRSFDNWGAHKLNPTIECVQIWSYICRSSKIIDLAQGSVLKGLGFDVTVD